MIAHRVFVFGMGAFQGCGRRMSSGRRLSGSSADLIQNRFMELKLLGPKFLRAPGKLRFLQCELLRERTTAREGAVLVVLFPFMFMKTERRPILLQGNKTHA